MIIIIHTYISSKYIDNLIKANHFAHKEVSFFITKRKSFINLQSFFLSDIFIYIKKNNYTKRISFGLILFLISDVVLFLNKTYLWVHFNKKEKSLPIFSSKNTTFYITSNIFNMENTITIYINQMKKLINYLGENNVIISIVENGDSTDNTRTFLEEFQNFLTEKKVVNKFILNHEIDDPRRRNFQLLKYSRLRIEYYSKLRNKCLEFLYQLPNIDFDNTIIIFFNDVVFNFEDIINLLSTNNEDYDAVCGLDMSSMLYDRWVSINLDGTRMGKYFPFFTNKEGQDLLINHKPIRVFSCWNGVIAFKALSLKDRSVQFRFGFRESPLYTSQLKDLNWIYYESECTYFNLDLHSLGYTKKFINPDVRVSYEYKYLFQAKYFIPSFKHIANYFWSYFVALLGTRNKHMSNYVDQKIKLNSILSNWYNENAIHNGH